MDKAMRLNGPGAAGESAMQHFLRRDKLQSTWCFGVAVTPRHSKFQHAITVKAWLPSGPIMELCQVLHTSPGHGDAWRWRLRGADPPHADGTTVTSICVQSLQRLCTVKGFLHPNRGASRATDGQR